MKRRHPMPFGTEIQDDGRVQFRLWAPGAQQVELCLQDRAPEALIPLAVEDGGWFGIATGLAKAGSLYSYRIDRNQRVPDPASRFQPQDVHGPSRVIDPHGFNWRDDDWRGRPWEQVAIYELHVGAFSEQGGFEGVQARLDYLSDLGVTAIELMPVSDFPGRHNWGYDGVLPFAPESRYGHPDALKSLV